MNSSPSGSCATLPLVILISGGGSNMRALVAAAQREDWFKRYGAEIVGVVSNRPDAAGLAFAQSHGIATRVVDHRGFADRASFEAELSQTIDELCSNHASQPWLLLAGFMRILEAAFVQRYAPNMFNIHPSLLPAFKGLHTHQRALDEGCRYAGATVHRVTPELDHGEILEQAVVPIVQADTAETLAQRVLTQEHVIYPKAIRKLLEKNLRSLP